MLNPDQLRILAWLLKHIDEKDTDEYKEKLKTLKESLSEEDSEILKQYKVDIESNTTNLDGMVNRCPLLGEIQKIEWIPEKGFVLTINDKECKLFDNKIFRSTYFKQWYTLAFGKKPDFGELKWDEVLDYILQKKQVTNLDNMESVERKTLILEILAKIKSKISTGVQYDKKDELKGKNRTAYYLYDDKYYYISARWMQDKLQSLKIPYDMANVYLRELVDKAKVIRIGDDTAQFWRFKRDEIDRLWETFQNEGQSKLREGDNVAKD